MRRFFLINGLIQALIFFVYSNLPLFKIQFINLSLLVFLLNASSFLILSLVRKNKKDIWFFISFSLYSLLGFTIITTGFVFLNYYPTLLFLKTTASFATILQLIIFYVFFAEMPALAALSFKIRTRRHRRKNLRGARRRRKRWHKS